MKIMYYALLIGLFAFQELTSMELEIIQEAPKKEESNPFEIFEKVHQGIPTGDPVLDRFAALNKRAKEKQQAEQRLSNCFCCMSLLCTPCLPCMPCIVIPLWLKNRQ